MAALEESTGPIDANDRQPGTPLTKAQKKRAAKKRSADNKKRAAAADGAAPRAAAADGAAAAPLDEKTMAAMIAHAKASMDKAQGAEDGQDQVKLAMQALSMVTGVLREQKGSEEGVLEALKGAAAEDKERKEREAARAVLRERVRAKSGRS